MRWQNPASRRAGGTGRNPADTTAVVEPTLETGAVDALAAR
jgi:hypothetical protein